MQTDLVTELHPSGIYENIVTIMDVYSRYLLAYSTSNQDAKFLLKLLLTICLARLLTNDTHPR